MALIRCPKCGRETQSNEAVVCGFCGNRLIPDEKSEDNTAKSADAVELNPNQQQTQTGEPECAVTQAAPEIYCQECGTRLHRGETVCPRCGCPAEQTSETAVCCRECGTNLHRGETVCPRCGCPVEQAREAVPVVAYAQMPLSQGTAVRSPAAPFAASAEQIPQPAANVVYEKARKRIMVYNIYALLSMIYPTILFFGDMFELKIGGMFGFSFGFLKFSEVNEKISDFAGALGSLFYSQRLEKLETLSTVLGISKYIFIAVVICAAFTFIKGIINAGKGKLLLSAFNTPLNFYVIMWVFCLIMAIIINVKLGEELAKKILITVNADAAPILVIGIINIVLYGIFKLVEGNMAQKNYGT